MDADEPSLPFGSDFTCPSTNKRRSRDNSRRVQPSIERSDPEFDRKARRASYQLPPASGREVAFRHSGWQLERARVRAALERLEVPVSRRERFENCGGDCVVEWSPSRKKFRLRANYCGDRFCVPCCRARAVKLQSLLAELLGRETPLFITLTLRNSDTPLPKLVSKLLASFRRLRQTELWKQHVRGGVAVMEIKKGAGGFGWHPHLHIIALGGYMPQALLSDAWRKSSGGSFVVDVQRARRQDDATSYACKYASKGWTAEVARDPDALDECITALRGRRLLTFFGDWHGRDVDDHDAEPIDWRRVGRLDNVLDAAERGERWAVGIARQIATPHTREDDNAGPSG